MRCKECLAFLSTQELIDTESLPAEVRAHLAGCPGCRGRLHALLLLEEGTGLRVRPPEGLAESIAARRGLAPAGRSPKGSFVRWIPLAAAAALALLVVLPVMSRLAGARGGQADLVRVQLTLDAPSALEVDVVGDWNQWNPRVQPMKRRDGKWEIVLELQRGRCYQYQFLIDGTTWIPDPNSPARVANGFGGVNSLIGS